MSKNTTDRTFEDEAYCAVDAVCNEFRRRLKQRILESGSSTISAEQVFSAVKDVLDDEWLKGFWTNGQINKAA